MLGVKRLRLGPRQGRRRYSVGVHSLRSASQRSPLHSPLFDAPFDSGSSSKVLSTSMPTREAMRDKVTPRVPIMRDPVKTYEKYAPGLRPHIPRSHGILKSLVPPPMEDVTPDELSQAYPEEKYPDLLHALETDAKSLFCGDIPLETLRARADKLPPGTARTTWLRLCDLLERRINVAAADLVNNVLIPELPEGPREELAATSDPIQTGYSSWQVALHALWAKAIEMQNIEDFIERAKRDINRDPREILEELRQGLRTVDSLPGGPEWNNKLREMRKALNAAGSHYADIGSFHTERYNPNASQLMRVTHSQLYNPKDSAYRVTTAEKAQTPVPLVNAYNGLPLLGAGWRPLIIMQQNDLVNWTEEPFTAIFCETTEMTVFPHENAPPSRRADAFYGEKVSMERLTIIDWVASTLLLSERVIQKGSAETNRSLIKALRAQQAIRAREIEELQALIVSAFSASLPAEAALAARRRELQAMETDAKRNQRTAEALVLRIALTAIDALSNQAAKDSRFNVPSDRVASNEVVAAEEQVASSLKSGHTYSSLHTLTEKQRKLATAQAIELANSVMHMFIHRAKSRNELLADLHKTTEKNINAYNHLQRIVKKVESHLEQSQQQNKPADDEFVKALEDELVDALTKAALSDEPVSRPAENRSKKNAPLSLFEEDALDRAVQLRLELMNNEQKENWSSVESRALENLREYYTKPHITAARLKGTDTLAQQLTEAIEYAEKLSQKIVEKTESLKKGPNGLYDLSLYNHTDSLVNAETDAQKGTGVAPVKSLGNVAELPLSNNASERFTADNIDGSELKVLDSLLQRIQHEEHRINDAKPSELDSSGAEKKTIETPEEAKALKTKLRGLLAHIFPPNDVTSGNDLPLLRVLQTVVHTDWNAVKASLPAEPEIKIDPKNPLLKNTSLVSPNEIAETLSTAREPLLRALRLVRDNEKRDMELVSLSETLLKALSAPPIFPQSDRFTLGGKSAKFTTLVESLARLEAEEIIQKAISEGVLDGKRVYDSILDLSAKRSEERVRLVLDAYHFLQRSSELAPHITRALPANVARVVNDLAQEYSAKDINQLLAETRKRSNTRLVFFPLPSSVQEESAKVKLATKMMSVNAKFVEHLASTCSDLLLAHNKLDLFGDACDTSRTAWDTVYSLRTTTALGAEKDPSVLPSESGESQETNSSSQIIANLLSYLHTHTVDDNLVRKGSSVNVEEAKKLLLRKHRLTEVLQVLQHRLTEYESLRKAALDQLESDCHVRLPEWRQKVYRIPRHTLELLRRVQWPRSQHKMRYNPISLPGEKFSDPAPAGTAISNAEKRKLLADSNRAYFYQLMEELQVDKEMADSLYNSIYSSRRKTATTTQKTVEATEDEMEEVETKEEEKEDDDDDDSVDKNAKLMKELIRFKTKLLQQKEESTDARDRRHQKLWKIRVQQIKELQAEDDDAPRILDDPYAIEMLLSIPPNAEEAQRQLARLRARFYHNKEDLWRRQRERLRKEKTATVENSLETRLNFLARTDPGYAYTALWWDHVRNLYGYLNNPVSQEMVEMPAANPAHSRINEWMEMGNASTPSYSPLTPEELSSHTVNQAIK